MEISGNAYRVLKYLKNRKTNEFINENDVLKAIKFHNRDDFNHAILRLHMLHLIEVEDSRVSIRQYGIDYLNEIDHANDELAYEDVFTDYDYCIIKFLYHNDWGVRLEEFPAIIKKKAPELNMTDEGSLGVYLYQQTQFIEHKNSLYKLNDAGKQHYTFETKRKEKTKEIQSPVTYVGHIGDKNYTTHGAKSPIADKSPVQYNDKSEPIKKKWYTIIFEEFAKNIFQYVVTAGITFVIGLYAGKSCNQSHNSKQPQQQERTLK